MGPQTRRSSWPFCRVASRLSRLPRPSYANPKGPTALAREGSFASPCLSPVQKAWGSELLDRLKTESGELELDLHRRWLPYIGEETSRRVNSSAACCSPQSTASHFTGRAFCGASCIRFWPSSANPSAASVRSVVFVTCTCGTTLLARPESCNSGWVMRERLQTTLGRGSQGGP